MRIPTSTIPSPIACFLITLYLIISFCIFVTTSTGSRGGSGSYETLLFVLFNAPIYVVMWILLMIACASSRLVRYKPPLLGLIFIIQTIAVMVNSGPSGGLGSSGSVNYIQMILTEPPYSGIPWFQPQIFVFFAALYDFLLFVLYVDLLLSQTNKKY